MGWSEDPGYTILVVDDDPGFCEALRRILSPRYDVWTANSVSDAHELLYEYEFGLVIIDYQLRDEIDGITFANYVKTTSPLSYTAMLTGYSQFPLIKRALNEGNIDKFLIKPFDTHELLEIVDNALAEFTTKRDVSQMLQSSKGIKMAQNLLTQVFDEKDFSGSSTVDLTGVVISNNSIPVYSKFLSTEHLKKFTDTIFSGFMTAINMVGQEVFSDDTTVDILKFGEISIYFKFYETYQFCFIIKHDGDMPSQSQLGFFEDFFDNITGRIDEDPDYFNARNNYIEELDVRLQKLRDAVIVE